MATQCTETFDRFATALGDFSCHGAEPIIDIRNPVALSNWTLPVIELLMVVIAVAALVHAIRRLRRDGDPVNLALWCATVIYLFVIEIPLYFPNVFGIEDMLGVVFAHNVFTVEFLFDRLPLYIVALYPAVVTLAYEVVRSLGVFRDRGPLLGALCVGFVHHCFYEVFDQLGPQLRWWAWNTDNALNNPMLASVPMTSMFIFATLGPVVVTVLVLFLVQGRVSGRAWRTVVAGVLTPLGLVLLSVPTTIFGGDDPNTVAQAVLFSIEIAAIAAVGVLILTRQWMGIRAGTIQAPEPNSFVRIFGPLYLVVLAVLWVTALPDYLGAADGFTADGTPTGSLLYAGASFVGAAVCVAAVLTVRQTAPALVTRP